MRIRRTSSISTPISAQVRLVIPVHSSSVLAVASPGARRCRLHSPIPHVATPLLSHLVPGSTSSSSSSRSSSCWVFSSHSTPTCWPPRSFSSLSSLPAGTPTTSSSLSSSLFSASAASSSSASSMRRCGMASSPLSRSHVHFIRLFAEKLVVVATPCKEAIVRTLQPAATRAAAAMSAALAWARSMWKQ